MKSSLLTESTSTLVHLDDLTFDPYLDQSEILTGVKAIASEINNHYRGKEIVLVGVLKGAFVFMNELIKHLQISLEIEFIRVSSYEGTSSTGKMNLSIDYPRSIKDKHIIIIEDIVDSGLTAKYLLDRAEVFDPASIRMASLFVKPDCVKTNVNIDYIGFEIPDHFIVGYGMDYNEKGRELASVHKIVK